MKQLSKIIPFLFVSAALLASATALAAPQPAPLATHAIVQEDVSKQDFNTTVQALKAQLAKDGWNLVAEVNLGERLGKKGVQLPGGLIILELTSGKNAVPLLKQDETRYVSALMPCSVSIYGMSDGRVIVSRMKANLMSGLLEPRVAEVMMKSAAQLDVSIAAALAGN